MCKRENLFSPIEGDGVRVLGGVEDLCSFLPVLITPCDSQDQRSDAVGLLQSEKCTDEIKTEIHCRKITQTPFPPFSDTALDAETTDREQHRLFPRYRSRRVNDNRDFTVTSSSRAAAAEGLGFVLRGRCPNAYKEVQKPWNACVDAHRVTNGIGP